MANDNEQVDWDKVNRGKVRYGFALELYKKGGDLKPSEMGRIEAFVDYVMDGMGGLKKTMTSTKPTKKKKEPERSDGLMSKEACQDIITTATEGSKAFIKGMVHIDAEGLKEDDLKKVLSALDSGKITMDNLQSSLDKIYVIKQGYK